MEADNASTEKTDPVNVDSSTVFFYGEPQRLQCLNFLLHLAPFSNDTLLIIGPAGSGKTVILKQFLHKGGEAWRSCFMQGEGLRAVTDLLQALQTRFSIRSLEDAARTEQIEVLVEEFQAVQKRNQRVILIIDDADKAGEDVIAFFDQLQDGFRRAGDGISLVLAGAEAFAQHPEVENLRNHGMHVFELTPLTLDETQNYIRNFLRKNGMPTDALSSGEMKRIHREANGNFAMTYNLARAAIGKGRHRLLGGIGGEEKASEDVPAAAHHDIVVPKSRYFIPLSLLLVFALLIAYRFGNLPIPDFIGEVDRAAHAPQPVVEQAPAPAADVAIDAESGEDGAIGSEDGGEDVTTLHALEGEPAPVAQPGPPEALTDAFDQLAMGRQVEGEGEAPPAGEARLPPVAEEAAPSETPTSQKSVPELLAEAARTKAQVPEVAPLAQTQPSPESAKSAPAAATPAPEPEPVAAEPAKAEPVPAPPPAAVVTEVDQPKVEAPPPAPALAAAPAPESQPTPAEVRGEDWLLEQPETAYTLQIMALNSDAAFRKMLLKVEDPSRFAIYRLLRNDKTLYALVYGSYDSRAAAEAAETELPKSLGKVSPLPKRMRDVQKDIRALPQ